MLASKTKETTPLQAPLNFDLKIVNKNKKLQLGSFLGEKKKKTERTVKVAKINVTISCMFQAYPP